MATTKLVDRSPPPLIPSISNPPIACALAKRISSSVSHTDAARRHRVEQSGRMQEWFRVRLVPLGVISADEHIDPRIEAEPVEAEFDVRQPWRAVN